MVDLRKKYLQAQEEKEKPRKKGLRKAGKERGKQRRQEERALLNMVCRRCGGVTGGVKHLVAGRLNGRATRRRG